MAYRIRPSRPPAGEIRRVAREQLGRALASLDAADRDPAGAAGHVHDVRVRCKRLRALLRLVEGCMGSAFEAEDARLSAAADALARARDAQVALETFDAVVGEAVGHPGVREIRATLDARRDLEAVAEDHDSPSIGRARAVLRESLASVADWPIDRLCADELWDAYRRTYRRSRRRLRNAIADPSPENVHAWRRWAKRHWFHVRLLRDASTGRMRKRAAALDRLTERLGRRHDLDVLSATIADLTPGPETARLIRERSERRAAALMFRAFRDGIRLFSDPPGAATRDLHKRWTRRRMPGRSS